MFQAPLILLYRDCGLILRMLRRHSTGRLLAVTFLFPIVFVLSANGSELPADKIKDPLSPQKFSVQDVIDKIGSKSEARLRHYFRRAGVPYPSPRVTLIGLKDEMKLEVWADNGGKWVHIVTYEIYAASGKRGPKRAAGDRQVPEGVYRITGLNPNSRFHLSMKLDYPNEYDRLMAQYDGRSNLGGDIYIHGKAKSIGCLAVGDANIEELFFLAAKTGTDNTKVIILPYDFRRKAPKVARGGPAWLPELYETLVQEMAQYRRHKAAWFVDDQVNL